MVPDDNLGIKMQNEADDGITFEGVFSVRYKWGLLPCQDIKKLDENIENAVTGPDLGFQRILACEDRSFGMPHVAGTNNWSRAGNSSYGVSMSLYDQNPFTMKITADPNADCFAVCRRGNNTILVMCDGVNRGNKARMAARSAVYGALRYINAHCFEQGEQPMNTHDVMSLLNEAVMAAHEAICRNVHWCTTICITFVVPLAAGSSDDVYAVCTANVGDSYAFIARNSNNTEDHVFRIEELTISSHDFTIDLGRETGGAIGPITDDDQPILTNLTFSMGYVKQGDIVFLTTDGVSDNFDPVIEKHADHNSKSTDNLQGHLSLKDRHTLSLESMQACLENFSARSEESLSASSLCGELMRHALLMSQDKRAILEDPQLYSQMTVRDARSIERFQKSPHVKSLLAKTRGKMDHASVCAVNIQSPISSSASSGPLSAIKEVTSDSNKHGENMDSVSTNFGSMSAKFKTMRFRKKRISITSLP